MYFVIAELNADNWVCIKIIWHCHSIVCAQPICKWNEHQNAHFYAERAARWACDLLFVVDACCCVGFNSIVWHNWHKNKIPIWGWSRCQVHKASSRSRACAWVLTINSVNDYHSRSIDRTFPQKRKYTPINSSERDRVVSYIKCLYVYIETRWMNRATRALWLFGGEFISMPRVDTH